MHKLAVGGLIALMLGGAVGVADSAYIIRLKNGNEYITDRYWYERAQVLFDTVMGRHKPHEAFGLMRIEIIGDKVPPGRLGITGHRLLHMSDKVCFVTSGSHRRSDHLALSDIEIGD